jgi:hypothetical protein
VIFFTSASIFWDSGAAAKVIAHRKSAAAV